MEKALCPDELSIMRADTESKNPTSALLHPAASPADPISCATSAIASRCDPSDFDAAERPSFQLGLGLIRHAQRI